MWSFLGELPETFPYSVCFDSGYPLRQLRSLFGYRDRYKLCPVLVSARSHLFRMMKWPRSSSTKVVGWVCSVRCTSCCIGISRCILFVCRQAQDLRHRVRCGLETLHQPVEIPQVQFLDKVLDMPVAVLRQVLRSMVQKTVVVTQLQSIEGRRHFLSCRRSSSPWSRLLSRSWRFRSCCSFWWSMSLLCGRADSQLLPWRRPWRSHSGSSLRNRRCSSSRSLSSCRDAEACLHGPCDRRDSPVAF